ncbi:MAG TPA: sugar transferase [Aequorivita sp.]|nr:sugar transferase [Aequorivita sp.]
MYKQVFKRWLDIIISFLALILLSPIFILVWLALTIANHGKPLFFQERPGYKERVFKIVKFKTMNDRTNIQGHLLPDSQRLTKVGALVRKTSLDELPQLINVLKGDMSLIGPRPLRTYYLPLYSDEQRRRHEVRPGITGWAQINGRNTISWTEKFKCDIYYVDNLSFKLDLNIFLMTIGKVFRAKDINASDNTTMEPFNGNN